MNLNQANRIITSIKARTPMSPPSFAAPYGTAQTPTPMLPAEDGMTWDVYPTHLVLGAKPIGRVTQKKGQTLAQLFTQVKADFQEGAPILQNTAHARRVRQSLQEMPKNVVRES